MSDILSLFGPQDLPAIEVDRAVAECRGGRPVLVTGGSALLVQPVETLEPPVLPALERLAAGGARLVLSATRLERLGQAELRAGWISLPTLDAARIERLSVAWGARLDTTAAPLSALDEAGLELVRLSALLPAFVGIPFADATQVDPTVARVSADALGAYRGAEAANIHIVSRAPMPLEDAPDSEIVIFRGGEGLRDHAAIIVGRPDFASPVLSRMHSACLTGDIFGSLKCDCGDQLRMTARHMAKHDGGVILYLDQEGRGNGLSNKIKAYRLQAEGLDTYDADEVLGFGHDQRHFDFAARMLTSLGIKAVRLMTNNPIKIAALEAAGVELVSAERIFGRPTRENVGYLQAKRDRAGHRIDATFFAPPVRGAD
jgi:GTP cyclohydrolase II